MQRWTGRLPIAVGMSVPTSNVVCRHRDDVGAGEFALRSIDTSGSIILNGCYPTRA